MTSKEVVCRVQIVPSPMYPSLHVHRTVSVGLPAAHGDVGDAFALHVLHAVQLKPSP